MTKRAYPFDINVSRQLKFHINDFENDMTVLKSIQEQTIKKLVDGSKRLNTPETATINQMALTPAENIPGLDRNRNFTQKCVTNYFTTNGKVINNPGTKITRSLEVLSRCFFCENGINSTYKCVRCLEFYCASCSFINYDESLEDSRICISCS